MTQREMIKILIERGCNSYRQVRDYAKGNVDDDADVCTCMYQDIYIRV
jgi:hypothetical protein